MTKRRADPRSQVPTAEQAADEDELSALRREVQDVRRMAHLADLLNLVQDTVMMRDLESRITYWNRGAERIKGYSAAEILGQPIDVLYTAEDRERGLPRQLLDQASRLGHVESVGWHCRKDGSSYWADEVVTAMRDEPGNLVGFVKVVRDLTERKRIEEERAHYLAEIERQRDFIQRLIDNAPALIFYVDRDLTYRMVNPETVRAMRIPAESYLGRSLLEVYGPRTGERLVPLFR